MSRSSSHCYDCGMAHILIVDDNQDDWQLLSAILSTAGHTVETASNGKDALARVLNRLPDAVLLDLVMPDMDGPSFLEVVRSYLRFHSLPVVIYTGLDDSPMIDRARTLKVSSILIKGKAGADDILKALHDAIVQLPT